MPLEFLLDKELKRLHGNVYTCLIYKSPRLETTEWSADDWSLNKLQDIYSMGQRKKEQIPESSTPCGPLIWEENIIAMESGLGKEREGTRRCVEWQGQPGWSLWWWKCSDVYYDVNTSCVNSTTVSQLVLREAEREIRELGKGYAALLTHAVC